MELASSCINRQIKLFKLYDKLIQWRNKCLETQSFCTPPNTSATDFETLFDEIMYQKLINKNLMPSSCTFINKKSMFYLVKIFTSPNLEKKEALLKPKILES
jgi:hypothetical protein